MPDDTALTASERILHRLGRDSFLTLWSHTNPHVQKSTGTGIIAHEVCDLLVVFENHLLIFSDKDNQLDPEAADLDDTQKQVKWRRWHKSAIKKSIAQLYGAESTLKQEQYLIFSDAALSTPLRVVWPPVNTMKVHRIAVANGAAGFLRKHFGNAGTIRLKLGSQHANTEEVGVITPKDMPKGFVHVFDETSIQQVMRELSTIRDFVDYLSKKEAFALSREQLETEESDLLAAYYWGFQEPTGYGFQHLESTSVVRLQDQWQRLESTGKVQARHQRNRVSYYWDHIIEELTQAVQSNNQHFESGNTFDQMELALRALASQGRLHRRLLSERSLEARGISTTIAGNPMTRVIIDDKKRDDGPLFYITALTQTGTSLSDEDYRWLRRFALEARMGKFLLEQPELREVVGLGLSGIHELESFDLIYVDQDHLREESKAYYLERYETFRQQTTRQRFEPIQTEESDFPDPE